MADLMRISGVGEEIRTAGICWRRYRKRPEMCRPDNLAAKIKEVNEDKKLKRQTPSESHVTKKVE